MAGELSGVGEFFDLECDDLSSLWISMRVIKQKGLVFQPEVKRKSGDKSPHSKKHSLSES
jgi:hypothetical protein